MTNDYDAIVIGSGLRGLTAGALYARNGNRVLVLEQHKRFGCAATTYHRGAMYSGGTAAKAALRHADPRDSRIQIRECDEKIQVDTSYLTINNRYICAWPSERANYVMRISRIFHR
jgi:phytoene dehydrogenase-like protein